MIGLTNYPKRADTISKWLKSEDSQKEKLLR